MHAFDTIQSKHFGSLNRLNVQPMIPRSVFESGAQKTCFDSFGELVCGNGIVEEDEECDCGFSEELCSEDQKCCNPANSSDPLKEGKPCEL